MVSSIGKPTDTYVSTSFTTTATATATSAATTLWLQLSLNPTADEKSSKEKFSSAAASTATASASAAASAATSAEMYHVSAAHYADEKSSKEKFSSAAASTATASASAAASAATSAEMYHASAAHYADEKSSKEKEVSSKDYVSRQSYRTALCEKLMDIVYEHGEWDDEISHSLRDWSVEVISFVIELPDDATYLTKIAAKVKALGEILNNFINPGCPIQVPYIGRNELLWEKADLIAYLERNGLPPIDSQPLIAEHHKLAQAIIEWVKVLPDTQRESSAKETGSGSAGVLACATSSSAGVVSCARAGTLISNDLLIERAKNAILQRQTEIAIRELKHLSLQREQEFQERCAANLQALRERLLKGQESLAATIKQQRESTAIVNQRVDEMGNVQRATALTLNNRIDRITTNLINSDFQLNGALSTVQHQTAQVAQLAAVSKALTDKVADLEKRIRKHRWVRKWGKK